MRSLSTFLVTGQLFLLLGGCASRSVQVGLRPAIDYRAGEVVRGEACGVLVWGFIPAGNNSRTERAYKHALADGGGILVDTKLQYSWYAIPFVGYLLCTTIEGRVVR